MLCNAMGVGCNAMGVGCVRISTMKVHGPILLVSSVLCRDPSNRLMDGQNKMWTGAYLCGRVWMGKDFFFFFNSYVSVSST